MNKRRASDKKRSSKSGKKRKETAVEYEDIVLYSKRHGRNITRSVPVSPSPSPKKHRLAGPSGLKTQFTQDSLGSSPLVEPMSDVFTDDLMSTTDWLPDEEDMDSSSKHRKLMPGKVRIHNFVQCY
jgi:hypothetical protein